MTSADKSIIVYLLIFGGGSAVLISMYLRQHPGGKWRIGSWMDTLTILFAKPDSPPDGSDEDMDK